VGLKKKVSSVRADDTMTSFSLVKDRNSLKNHNNQVNNNFFNHKTRQMNLLPACQISKLGINSQLPANLFNIDWWQTMPSDKDSIPCKK
jgi:hypothetical protein